MVTTDCGWIWIQRVTLWFQQNLYCKAHNNNCHPSTSGSKCTCFKSPKGVNENYESNSVTFRGSY